MPHMFRLVTDSVLATPVVSLIAADVVDAGSTADNASSRLSMVIAGLIALAVVIAISTIVFWRATRPDRARGREVGIRWIESNEVTPAATWNGAGGVDPAPSLPDISTSAPGAIRATPADG